MAKKLKTLASARIRAIVVDVLAQRAAKGKSRTWPQAVHAIAVAKAAGEFAARVLAASDKPGKDAEGKPTPSPRSLLTWHVFAQDYSESGFAAGNLSQFQQTLDGLAENDPCYVKRVSNEEELEDYS